MNPVRKNMPVQIVPFVTVSRNAWPIPAAVSWTAPICDIPRFSIRSPALAHTTIAKTITSVLIRSLLSLAIFCGLVVSGSRRRLRHGNHGLLVILAALTRPFEAFGAQFQELRGFRVQPFPFMAVPQGFLHDAPHHFWPEIVL